MLIIVMFSLVLSHLKIQICWVFGEDETKVFRWLQYQLSEVNYSKPKYPHK